MLPKTHILMTTLISILLTILIFLLKQKFKMNFSSSSSVECGFTKLSEKKNKFSNQFFMIAIMFVIFDMELIAILPIPLLSAQVKTLTLMTVIILLLSFSLMMEWMNGLLEWVK